jgi:hypothetical protein
VEQTGKAGGGQAKGWDGARAVVASKKSRGSERETDRGKEEKGASEGSGSTEEKRRERVKGQARSPFSPPRHRAA